MHQSTIVRALSVIAITGLSGLATSPARADATPECNTGGGGGNSIECGFNTISNDRATSVGYQANAAALNSTAIGTQARAAGIGAIAIGTDIVANFNNSIAIGSTAFVGSANSTAIGSAVGATGQGAVATGNASSANGQGAVAIGNNVAAAGVGSVALGNNSIATSTGAIAIGNAANANGNVGLAIGTGASNGGYSFSVALGAGSVNTAASQVHVGGRTIGGVANGVVASDAVNLGQLTAATAGLNSNVIGLQNDVGALYDITSRDRREARRGTAAAVAMSEAPMPSRDGGVSYSVHGASYRGEYAVGGSLKYRISGGAAFDLGVSHAGGKDTAIRAGVSGEF